MRVCLCTLQVKRDEEHKLVKSKVVNDEEVVRVPLAFAIVKLMQSLPKDVMEENLPRYTPLLRMLILLELNSRNITHS